MNVEIPAAEELEEGRPYRAGSLEFEVFHTPGHSPGGVTLKIGNTLFTGDALFAGSIGRSDFPEQRRPRPAGGDPDQAADRARGVDRPRRPRSRLDNRPRKAVQPLLVSQPGRWWIFQPLGQGRRNLTPVGLLWTLGAYLALGLGTVELVRRLAQLDGWPVAGPILIVLFASAVWTAVRVCVDGQFVRAAAWFTGIGWAAVGHLVTGGAESAETPFARRRPARRFKRALRAAPGLHGDPLHRDLGAGGTGRRGRPQPARPLPLGAARPAPRVPIPGRLAKAAWRAARRSRPIPPASRLHERAAVMALKRADQVTSLVSPPRARCFGVMSVGPVGRPVAAGNPAAAVACYERPAEAGRYGPHRPLACRASPRVGPDHCQR